MLHDPKQKELFPDLPEDVLQNLPNYGQVLDFEDGQVLFSEGEKDYPFFAVLDGKVRVTKRFGQEMETLAVHQRGHFAGEISMLTGRPAIANGVALGHVRVVRIENARFRKFIAEGSDLAKTVLKAMSRRTDEVESQTRQQEKLAALGKMSAGLAHELNNPASAVKRAAQLLQEALEELRSQCIRYDCRFTEAEREVMWRIETELTSRNEEKLVLDALERSDLEEELANWLDQHDAPDAWDLAPTLAEAGFTIACMNTMATELKPESLLLGIGWVEKSLRAAKLASEIRSASTRISDLVSAMKDYTYMDRADFQVTDIHRGLDSTLAILNPKLKNTQVKVVRQFGKDVPPVCAHPGELNQVWTNLISNALDAMNGTGTLTITTRPDADGAAVEIADTGPGIPPEIQARIFEPFFTTKPVGQGTGLGLDIVYRIVRGRHGGNIRVTSTPGDTRFEVTLLANPPREMERL